MVGSASLVKPSPAQIWLYLVPKMVSRGSKDSNQRFLAFDRRPLTDQFLEKSPVCLAVMGKSLDEKFRVFNS